MKDAEEKRKRAEQKKIEEKLKEIEKAEEIARRNLEQLVGVDNHEMLLDIYEVPACILSFLWLILLALKKHMD